MFTNSIEVVESYFLDIKDILSTNNNVDFSSIYSTPLSLGYHPEKDREIVSKFQTDFWFLASQFLLSYFELKSFEKRARNYFKTYQGDFEIPQESIRKFEDMANNILNHNPTDFDDILCANNHEKLKELLWNPFALNQPIKIDPEYVTDYVTSIHTFLNLIIECKQLKENLPNSVIFILEICTEPFDILKKSPKIIQNKIINSLNNYKNTQLILDGYLGDYSPAEQELILLSPLLRIRKDFNPMDIRWFLEKLNQNSSAKFSKFASLIESRIRQSSYSEFLESILNEEFLPYPLGEINLIPSNESSDCHELLLAVSNDNEGSCISFKEIMAKVLLHLVQCDNTKIVVFICNKWDNSIFNTFYPQLTVWANFRKVNFLFLLVSGSNDVNPLCITF